MPDLTTESKLAHLDMSRKAGSFTTVSLIWTTKRSIWRGKGHLQNLWPGTGAGTGSCPCAGELGEGQRSVKSVTDTLIISYHRFLNSWNLGYAVLNGVIMLRVEKMCATTRVSRR